MTVASPDPAPLDLARVRAMFPGYLIMKDARRDPPRYAAVARELTTSPYAIVTADLDQLAGALAAGDPQPRNVLDPDAIAGQWITDSADLTELRRAFPDWKLREGWIAASSGPDKRLLTAVRGDTVLTAFSPASLARMIAGEQP